MSAKQVFYRFYSSNGRKIDIRGFSMRDNNVISDTPPITNKTHQQQNIPLIPSVRPGNPINIQGLIDFAKENGYSLVQNDAIGSEDLNSEAVTGDLNLNVTNSVDSVTLGWTGDDGTYEIQRSVFPNIGFNTIENDVFTGSKTFEDTDVVDGDTFYYRIRLIESDNNKSIFSDSVEANVTNV